MRIKHHRLFFALSAISLILSPTLSRAQNQPEPVKLHWLNGMPGKPTGVSWGVPWPQGAVKTSRTFALTSGDKVMPLQNWTLAYWPDGSVKWSAFATVAIRQLKILH